MIVHVIDTKDLQRWVGAAGVGELFGGLTADDSRGEYIQRTLRLPAHLRFIHECHVDQGQPGVPNLASIPFYSLCRGLFLPLSGMSREKAAFLFGLSIDESPKMSARDELVSKFFEAKLGLSFMQKLACVLGDPFYGRPSTLRRDSLLRLLLSVSLQPRRQLLSRLAAVGEIAALFAESRSWLRGETPMTAAEVLEFLRLLPLEKRALRFNYLRSVLARCGKLEAYYLAQLILRRAGFGFDYQGPLLARKLAAHFGAPPEQVQQAMALTDAFVVAKTLSEAGVEGLREIQLQPLVPVRPALASGNSEVKRFPVWVERKYDGIRLMLHKSTGSQGSVLCGAYTRNRGDWLEQISGLPWTLKLLPCASAIIDGELHGTMVEYDRVQQASVYDVHSAVQGDQRRPVSLKYAAFDLLYCNGVDLTPLPLSQRRQQLAALIAPLAGQQLPLPIALADGQMAETSHDIKRLYQHFRAQGYEGIIAKDLARPYALSARDPTWIKRKPEVTLDLVLLGAAFAVSSKTNAGLFGSYVIAARSSDNTFEDVGDVAGVDRQRDAQIQQEIAREGLLTGRRIERVSASGTRPGLELRPHIVVTIKLSEVKKDFATNTFSLRDPKLVIIRVDKSPFEASTLQELEQLYLKQRVG